MGVFIVLSVIFGIYGILLFIVAYQKSTNAVCMSKKRLDGKTAIVTGGTAGMGLEIAKDFALRGARVIIACPFENEGAEAQKQIIQETENKNIEFKLLDLGSFKSTREFAEDILKHEDRLDILINNAGVGGPSILSADGLNLIMQVNYFGGFLLTILLLPLLRKTGRLGEPSRIINTGSICHNFGKIQFDYLGSNKYYFIYQIYGNSKLCVLLFNYELAKRLKDSNVVVNAVDPGLVGTNIWAGWNSYFGVVVSWACFILFKTPWQGAQTTIHAALDKKAGEISGKYFKNCRIISPKKEATHDKLVNKLWEQSAQLVKLSFEEINHCLYHKMCT